MKNERYTGWKRFQPKHPVGLGVAVVLDLTAAEAARNDEVENVVCNLCDDRPGDPAIR